MMIKKTSTGVSGSTGSRHAKGFVPALRSAIAKTATFVKGTISLDEKTLRAHATPMIQAQGKDLEDGLKREMGFFLNYGRVFADLYQGRAQTALTALETALALPKDTKPEALRKAMQDAVNAFNG